MIKSADTKNKFLSLVSATVIRPYQKGIGGVTINYFF
jgi:hypothetical protein